MSEMIRVSADEGVCISAGNCALAAPGVFTLDDDGIVEVLMAEVSGDAAQAATGAADNCPSFAITIERITTDPTGGN